MFDVTDTAARQLKKVLAELRACDDVRLRLGETQGELKMLLDQERPGDTAVKHGDEVLLVIDAATAGRLDGRTMDFDESSQQLVFT